MNIQEIDAFLFKLESATSDDQLRKFFTEYSSSFDTDVPSDPFSIEYRQKQFDLYQKLAGKRYSVSNEQSKIDIDYHAINPFPYCHGSSETVGNQLMAIGFIIKTLNLPKGARILEFGPGWGNTTLALAKMGYKVTAVDIEKNFIELIRKRALMEQLEIELICDDFSYIKTIGEPYDSVLFFECFHHAADHLSIMESFEKAVKPGGIVCFGAEPITDAFPIPWGLRMDGESLWAIRKNGWLELGFNTKYFQSALSRFGWLGIPYQGSDGPWSKAIVAKRMVDLASTYGFNQEGLLNQVGTVISGVLQTTGEEEGYVAYGPYVALPAGTWVVEILFDASFNNFGNLIVDAVAENGLTRIAEETNFEIKLHKKASCTIVFENETHVNDFEIRIRCLKGARIRLNGIKLTYV